MIKLVAFDWNGTLLADTAAAWKSDIEVFKYFNHPPISFKKFLDTYDIPIINYWTANGFDKEEFLERHKEIHAIFESHYKKNTLKVRTRSGAKPLLRWLAENNIQAIIYSNHIVPDIEKSLRHFGISSFISDILARTENDGSHMHSRSKEQKLRDYIKQHGYKPGEVISVGDTVEEVEIGSSLGLCSVALTGGCSSARRLKACHPDFLIHNLKDLIPMIKKCNSR